MTDAIYNRFDPAKNFERHLFHPDRVLQSAELNELQSQARARLKDIADVLFREGDIIRGSACIVDASTGAATLEAGALYIAGAVRGIPPARLTVSTVGLVYIGAYLQTSVVTEIEDPTLLNPALGTRGYEQPGAYRERIALTWGVQGDGTAGTFYPVWTIEDGWVRPKEPPPNLDAVSQAISRYDRDSAGGTYVVRGMGVVMGADLESGEQVYTVREGTAHVNGVTLPLPYSRRVVYPAAPDLKWIDSEPHASTTASLQRINFDRTPVVGPVQVRIQARRTVNVVHGGFVGAADPLPDSSVVLVESVAQGATTYNSGTSWNLTAGQIDWSPGGAEPAPGTNYTVTYQYMATVPAQDQDATGLSVEGALPGTLVLLSYNQALRRIDRLAMDSEGTLHWLRGVSAEWSPVAPKVPTSMLALVSVYQSWDTNRRLVQDAVRVVPMDELVAYAKRLDAITTDLAEVRLAVDVAGRYSGIKKGLFADPMLDNAMRDAGLAQTATVAAGALQLRVLTTAHQVGTTITTRQAPAHLQRTALAQTLRTATMRVNPYDAFDVLPGPVTLNPAVDRWTDVQTVWASPQEERFYSGSGGQQITQMSDRVTTTLSEVSSDLATLRQITVAFELQQFGPGEGLSTLTFDGIDVDAEPLPGGTLLADGSGVLRGTFTIPAGIPAGAKTVRFTGTGGSHGDAIFTGQGSLLVREQAQVTRYWIARYDPLAQTFTVSTPTQCTGVDLWFDTVGSTVQVQLREVDAGFPSSRVLAEAMVLPSAAQPSGQHTRVTWSPVLLDAGQEYCIVALCNDATTALFVAELAGWDESQSRWVTTQPYQVGVLLSSSNASTWTAHQDRDLTFRLLSADYSESTRTIDLGTADVVDMTDVMVRAFVHEPSALATASFSIELEAGQTLELAEGQVAQLAARYTGQVTVRAHLHASSGLGAVLEPGVQLIAGSLQTTGTYITPTLNAAGGTTARVIYEANLPAGTAVQVHMQIEGEATWTLVPFSTSSPQTTGVLELTHELGSIAADRVRFRLSLTGSHTARPEVYNLRAVVM